MKPIFEYRIWEFDPTWPEAERGPLTSLWTDESGAREMMSAAMKDRPSTCQIKMQRRHIMYGPPEDCSDPT